MLHSKLQDTWLRAGINLTGQSRSDVPSDPLAIGKKIICVGKCITICMLIKSVEQVYIFQLEASSSIS